MGIFSRKKNNNQIAISIQDGSIFNSNKVKKNSIALSCMDLIASSISSLPLDVYKKTTTERIKDTGNPLHQVLKLPNYDEPKSIFYYQLVQDYFKEGNVFLFKYYKDDEIYSLFRVDPSTVKVSRNSSNQKVFKVGEKVYDYNTILHIPARYDYDGLIGKSIFDYYKNAFELAQIIDEYFKYSFENGMNGNKRVILDVSEYLDNPNLTTEQIKEIKKKLLNDYTGVKNTDKPIIKSVKGVNYTTLDGSNNTNREQQLSENLTVTQNLICKVFNVPESLLSGKNEYNNLESLYVLFLDFAVRPIVDNFIDGFSQLIPANQRETVYIEANYNNLMRIDLTSKIDAYVKQVSNGILTLNEVRQMENRIGLGEAGDFSQTPSNLIPVSMEVINARLATQKLAVQELDNDKNKTGEY